MERKVIHTRHVLAVNDLAASADYFVDCLGFDRDFTAPGWEFLSFGAFKLMLGECGDEVPAEKTNNHSYFAHVLVEDVDSIYKEFAAKGAQLTSRPEDKPWGLREFAVKTPEGHRITFGHLIDRS
jgi:uncharacterized glyoxalase superfamily protein PhnB